MMRVSLRAVRIERSFSFATALSPLNVNGLIACCSLTFWVLAQLGLFIQGPSCPPVTPRATVVEAHPLENATAANAKMAAEREILMHVISYIPYVVVVIPN